MKSLRHQFVGIEELPPSLGKKALEVVCQIDPRHLSALLTSDYEPIARLSIAAQYVFLQVTGAHSKSDAAVPPAILNVLSNVLFGHDAPLATFRAVTNFSDNTLKGHRKWFESILAIERWTTAVGRSSNDWRSRWRQMRRRERNYRTG